MPAGAFGGEEHPAPTAEAEAQASVDSRVAGDTQAVGPAKAVGAVPILMYHIVSDGARDWDCLDPADCGNAAEPAPAPVPPEVRNFCGSSAGGPPLAGSMEKETAPPHMVVSSGSLETQLRFLKDNGYRTLTLDEFLTQRVPLTGRDVILTFDDGYEDNFAAAFPLLRRFGMKANLFMVADNVGRPGRLSADQLREMDAHGFKVYSHTKTHPHLSALPAEAQCVELLAAKRELEVLLGRPVEFVAYPYGDFKESVTDKVAERAGYSAAFTTAPGPCDRDSSGGFLNCPRFAVSDVDRRSFQEALRPVP